MMQQICNTADRRYRTYVVYISHFIACVGCNGKNKQITYIVERFQFRNHQHLPRLGEMFYSLLIETCDVLFLENVLRLMKVRYGT